MKGSWSELLIGQASTWRGVCLGGWIGYVIRAVITLCCCICVPNYEGCTASTGVYEGFKLFLHLTSRAQGFQKLPESQ
eukprot:443139-Pelagomonas_calceolata.AAC.4